MKKTPKNKALRERAEKVLAQNPKDFRKISFMEVQKIIHELQVHQIELEMQNEELREAQAEIERSRSRYADLYDYSPAGYLSLESSGKVRDVNLAGAGMLGFEKSQMISKPFRSFVAPEYRNSFSAHLLKVTREPGQHNLELKLVKADQTPFWVSLQSLITSDQEKPRLLIQSAFMDISDQKRMEEALLQSERELRLFPSRLLQAQEEERKRIAADVHDSLGSDLSVVKLKLEKVLEGFNEQGRGKEVLTESIASVNRCIKEVGRIQAGLRPSVLDDLGLESAINWLCREFSQNYSLRVEKNIKLKEDQIPVSLKTVIFRTLQEALHNAARHSRADRSIVSLKVDDSMVHLKIEDRGQGFDYQKLGLSKKGAQRGIGLFSMKERVEDSGGSFHIESERGKGTTITVFWPLG
jgi:PAS domain S-box-containing protein